MEQFTTEGKKKGIEDSFEIRVKKKPSESELKDQETVQPVTQEQKNKFTLTPDKIKKTSASNLAQQLLKILNS